MHILLTLLTFLALAILQKLQVYPVWFLFVCAISDADSYSCHFGAINK